jgi:zinc D-Ala-D-Ala carboxypeptidase
MNKISDHISYAEATRSDAAIRAGIPNDPAPQQLENIKMWAVKVFEPTRTYISMKRGKDSPIIINSIFRNIAVNRLIGGSDTSSHCAGESSKIEEAAGDIECHFPDFNNKDLFQLIKEKGAFDQLIAEYIDDKNPAWIHVGWRKHNNRMQILIAEKVNGKTAYHPFSPQTWTRIYG